MHNCILCGRCHNDRGWYKCTVRNLSKDSRFPYRSTKCKEYIKDRSLASLSSKGLTLLDLEIIGWEMD